jgi:hypothetical protein
MSNTPDPTEAIINNVEEHMNGRMHSLLGYGDDYKSAPRESLQTARTLLQGEFALVRARPSHQRWQDKIGIGNCIRHRREVSMNT